eukprot:1035673-Pyramimonas_sp.AAC.1
MYNCFLDEGLNSLLRDICQYAHRSTLEFRCHSLFELTGALNLSRWISSNSAACGSLVSGR